MAKKITNRPAVPHVHQWDTNERPYDSLIHWYTENMSAEEKQAFIESFYDTHTYLMIAELGRMSPSILELVNAYEGEKKNGLGGFVKARIEDDPTFFDKLYTRGW